MLHLDHLCAGYGGTEVLHQLSFDLPVGENLCILGPNGCGKTTLLRILIGVETCDSAHIHSIRACLIGRLHRIKRACRCQYLYFSHSLSPVLP